MLPAPPTILHTSKGEHSSHSLTHSICARRAVCVYASNGVENCFCAPMFVGRGHVDGILAAFKTHTDSDFCPCELCNMLSCVSDNIQPPWCLFAVPRARWGMGCGWGGSGVEMRISLACARCDDAPTSLRFFCAALIRPVCLQSSRSKERTAISFHAARIILHQFNTALFLLRG